MPGETTLALVRQMVMDVVHNLCQLTSGFSVKLPLVAAGSAASIMYTEFFGGDLPLLVSYWLFFFFDLMLGVGVAVKFKIFSVHRLGRWVLKLLTHVTIILMVAILSVHYNNASPVKFPLLDSFLLWLLTTEAVSIFTHMDELGLPVPLLARELARKVRDKACKRLGQITEVKGDEPEK